MPNSTTPLIIGGSLHDSQTIKLPTSEQEIFPYEAYQHSDLTTELPKEDVEKMEKSVKTKRLSKKSTSKITRSSFYVVVWLHLPFSML